MQDLAWLLEPVGVHALQHIIRSPEEERPETTAAASGRTAVWFRPMQNYRPYPVKLRLTPICSSIGIIFSDIAE